MTKIDELKLIKLCLLGRRDCYEPLVKKYQSSVLAVAINILGNYDEAQDILQDTFISAYIHLDRFDTERNFKTWLISIAVNRCLDHLRKQKSFLKYFLKQSQGSPDEQNKVYSDYKVIEDSEFFLPLLKKLKEKERIALVLKMNENYSAKEIGEVLKCSENTVRVHQFNAKQKIKKWLALSGNNRSEKTILEV